MFALIYTHFASVTAIYNPIEKTGALVCPISYCLFVFCIVIFILSLLLKRPHLFQFFVVLNSSLSSFRIKSGKNPPF